MIIFGIIALGVLVFVHEFGHFLVAKLNGVGVLEFSIGFGRKIVKKTIGETTYAIGVIPLGGYVRMVGDDPYEILGEGKNPADLIEGKDTSEALSPIQQAMADDRSRWFLLKGFWSKSAIVLAGPVFNVLFAILLAFFLFLGWGRPDIAGSADLPIVGEVTPGFPAEKAGIRRDDTVLSIDGKPLTTWTELSQTLANSGGRELNLHIRRDDRGAPIELDIKVAGTFDTSELSALDDSPEPIKRPLIGIDRKIGKVPVSVIEAAKRAPTYVWFLTRMTVRGLYGLASGEIGSKNIGGPIFIFGEAARSAERGADYLINFMILLSVSLAIFNLLPIPVLDGGHLLFFIIGAVRGNPVSVRAQQIASQVGMAVLLTLMLFAVKNDIFRYKDAIVGFFS